MRARLHLYTRALVLARYLVGGILLIVGGLIIGAGESGISGPTLRDVAVLPAWVWGTAAAVAGVLTLWRRTSRVGLVATAGWYLVWGLLVAKGGATNPGAAWFPPAVYLQMALTALLLLAVQRVDRRDDRREARRA